jgi:hypothetical protein
MVIATSITESYLERSQPLFKSVVENFSGTRICFTIGFETTIEGWECIKTELPECTWQPDNRKDFYTLQHGEFVKYIPDTEPDEMILFIDSDMIMQREWDITMNSTRAISVTASSWPLNTLMQVVENLGIKGGKKKKLCKLYDIHKDYKEFCTAFIIASFDQWENIYRAIRGMYVFLDNFKHHAAWQLLINLVVLSKFQVVKILPEHICNATWYTGTRAKGSPLTVTMMGTKKLHDGGTEDVVSDEVIYFNHTKFN